MTAWEHFEHMLRDRVAERRAKTGLLGEVVSEALEIVAEVAHEAFKASVKDRSDAGLADQSAVQTMLGS